MEDTNAPGGGGRRDPLAQKRIDKAGEGKSDEFNAAEAFAELHRRKFQHDPQRNCWMMWDGACWQRREDEAQKALRELYPTLRRNSQQQGALKQAQSMMTRRGWDEDARLAVPFGYVNFDERAEYMREPTPELYSTRCTAVSPIRGHPKLWLDTLSACHKGKDVLDVISYLQRLFGYCLTRDTSEQIFALWIGGGANGKSTVADTVAGIMSSYSRALPRALAVKERIQPHAAIVAQLDGVRLAVCGDLEGGLLDASRIKQLTGGDKMAAQYMRQEWFEFEPVCKLVLLTNQFPRVSVDKAIRRRFHVLEWKQEFDSDRDKNLKEKLRAEWPQILHWMLAGYDEWKAKGLAPPAPVLDATRRYLEQEDTKQRWLDECCERSEQAKTTAAALLKSCRRWHEENGFRPPSDNVLGRWLTGKGFEACKVEGKRGRAGLFLRELL